MPASWVVLCLSSLQSDNTYVHTYTDSHTHARGAWHQSGAVRIERTSHLVAASDVTGEQPSRRPEPQMQCLAAIRTMGADIDWRAGDRRKTIAAASAACSGNGNGSSSSSSSIIIGCCRLVIDSVSDAETARRRSRRHRRVQDFHNYEQQWVSSCMQCIASLLWNTGHALAPCTLSATSWFASRR